MINANYKRNKSKTLLNKVNKYVHFDYNGMDCLLEEAFLLINDYFG